MILVTCAAGKTGKAIVDALVKTGQDVRAMVRWRPGAAVGHRPHGKVLGA